MLIKNNKKYIAPYIKKYRELYSYKVHLFMDYENPKVNGDLHQNHKF